MGSAGKNTRKKTPVREEPASSRKRVAKRRGVEPADGARGDHSHSMVAGGLELMSSSTRETPRTSLVMREEIFASRS